MARKRRKRSKSTKKRQSHSISDEVKQSIFAVILFLAGILVLLSFFDAAGAFGVTINDGLANLFGWTRWLLAPFLLAIAWQTMFPDKGFLNVSSYIGIALTFIGLTGVSNLFLASAELSGAGGYLGLIISSALKNLVDGFAAGIIGFALLVIGLVLIFNFSFGQISFGVREKRERDDFDDDIMEDDFDDNEDPLLSEEDEEEEEMDLDDMDVAAAPAYAKEEGEEESIMTSKRRRKIQIPIDLLEERSSDANGGDTDRNQEMIRKTFAHFNIDVEMMDVRVGPTVTQYSLRPPHGVKLSRIVGLQNDLALALAAHPIRIEAPIPGKSLVGIEVPNQTVGSVGLRELLESREFKRRKSHVTAPLGKDVAGHVISLMVDKAPHMLVAGATGSGKSVCLNTIITSLLYQNGPDDLKFIMVDPKRVELGRYSGIPHLLTPPIVKVEEALNALRWAVREMERRLDHLAKFGVRDIDSYNKKSKERMPKIVILIDELSDLMSQNKRDVESLIVRIAQMARAAGIHLILATQRPSVDVITGIIKANIPTRLAFAVASQVDSKTILDVSGAEKLLGRGDMLASTPQTAKPKRLQGAFVSDDEIAAVVQFLKKEGEPDYNHQIVEDQRLGGTSISASNADPMIDNAVEVILQSKKASTSYLQRRLRIGYSRAASIIDMLEEMGVIGPQNGSKPREVLIDSWPPGAGQDDAASEEVYDDEQYDDHGEDDAAIDLDDEEMQEGDDLEE